MTTPSPYAKLTLAAVSWGGAFAAGKVALGHLPPLTTAFWRFAVGTAALLGVWAWREGPRSLPRSPRTWGGIAALGLTGVFAYNALFSLFAPSVS